MRKNILIIPIFVLLSNCNGQNKRIELNSECLEYFGKTTPLRNTEFKNVECAEILNKGGDFILKYDKNESRIFSTIESGKIDGKMFHIVNGDTLSNSTYSQGKLIDRISFNNGKIDKTERLENNIYNIKFLNFEKNWLIDGEISFKSKSITFKRNLRNELLELNYIDSLGNKRLTTDYTSNTSFLYNSKGKLIIESNNSIINPELKVAGGTTIISPMGLNLKPYPFKSNTKEHNTILYDDNGDLIQKNIFNLDDIYGKNIKTSYFNSGKIRKKELLYLNGGIKTRTYDLNNNLIKETIKIMDDNPEIAEPPLDDDDILEEIIQEEKN